MSLFLQSTFFWYNLSYYRIWKAWNCCVLQEHFLKRIVFYMSAVFVKNAKGTDSFREGAARVTEQLHQKP